MKAMVIQIILKESSHLLKRRKDVMMNPFKLVVLTSFEDTSEDYVDFKVLCVHDDNSSVVDGSLQLDEKYSYPSDQDDYNFSCIPGDFQPIQEEEEKFISLSEKCFK